jgi:hypothetical protein
MRDVRAICLIFTVLHTITCTDELTRRDIIYVSIGNTSHFKRVSLYPYIVCSHPRRI